MKSLNIFSFLLLTLIGLSAQGQSFFGYQSIGVHTVYCALSFQNEQPRLGVGYTQRRNGGTQFRDFQVEWHFPLTDMYSMQNHQMIVGVYWGDIFGANSRSASNLGTHLRITRQTQGEKNSARLGLAITYLPSYAFSTNTGDGLYGVAGLRGTYEAVLMAKTWTPQTQATATWQALPIHHIEVGGNLSAHLERTLGLSVNGFKRIYLANNASQLMEGEGEWKTEGNLYFGSTYYLERWFR